MSKIATRHAKIKDKIRDYHTYFLPNIKRYQHFMNFVFNTSLSESDITLLQEMGKPQVEFNILESCISRLLGEFSQQEPSFEVREKDSGDPIDAHVLQVAEGYLRSILFDSNRDNMEYDIYAEQLGGGFSAIRVLTDYVDEKSFHQKILIRKCYDPSLTVFDRLARESHKGDGMICGELYPLLRTEFESRYGKKYTENMSFLRNLGDFSWSYMNDKGEEIVLVGDIFEKRKKKAKIVQLIDGRVMTDEEYQMNVEHWKKQTDVMIQIPGIVGTPRQTELTTIYHSIVTENDLINEEETDFKYLPIVFVDGNSKMLKNGKDGPLMQMTRPYVYHAEGIQKLKNLAGITLANQIESLIASKIMAFKESIPAEYKDAWIQPQTASILIANGFKDDNPDVALPMPQIITQQPTPPEITSTFGMSDEAVQQILGNFDAVQGNAVRGQLSGVAIQNGAIQSNTASRTYLVGYMKAWQRIADICLDLIPKYITMPRSIPVQGLDGKRNYQKVNMPGQPSLDYDSNSLEVKVEAGVNFEIQRQKALDTLQGLMKTSPIFAQIIGNTPQGCEMILDNIDIRGVEVLKKSVPEFFQKQAMAQQQQLQMQQQMNPMVLKQQELQVKAQKNQMDYEIAKGHLSVEQEQNDTDRLNTLNDMGDKADKNELEQMKIQAEQSRTAVDALHKMSIVQHNLANTKHSHAMDLLNLHHKNDQFHKKLNSETQGVQNAT